MEKESITDLYEQLSDLDKKIRRLQEEKQKYFLNNVDEKDKTGDIKVPLVIGTNDSDYEKLKDEKKKIIYSIEKNKQYINKFQFYIKGTVSSLRKDGLSEEEINTKIEEIRNIYEERILNLENILKMIDENPKLFLRIAECERRNYSMVNSKDAVSELKKYDKSIKDYKTERKNVNKLLVIHIQKDEKLKKTDRVSLDLKLIKNKKRKS